MPKLLLHIGMPKTGSTAIQNTLSAHGKLLRHYGCIYPEFCKNHGNFLIPAFEPEGHAGAAQRMREMLTDEAELLVERLVSIVQENKEANFILSGENFAPMSEVGAFQLFEFLRSLFEEIRIIGFVRPPVSLVHSLAQEQIQNMGFGYNWLEDGRLYLPYKRDLEKWNNIGSDVFQLRIFSRQALTRGCAVASLLAFAGLPAGCYEKMIVEQSNQALSMLATELICVANEDYPPRKADKYNPARAKRLSTVLCRVAGSGCPKFHAPEPFVRRTISASKGEIKWVENLLGETLSAFDKEPPPDVPRFKAAVSDARRFELAALVKAVNDELLLAQRV